MCDDPNCYESKYDINEFKQTNIGVINEKLLNFYANDINYFRLLLEFKPPHARCCNCKNIYNVNPFNDFCNYTVAEKYVICPTNASYVFSEEEYVEVLYWSDDRVKNLPINGLLCMNCIDSFITQKILAQQVTVLETNID